VNLLVTAGSVVLAAGVLVTGVNLLVSLRRGEPAGPDPFGGDTLEWTTPSPPPPWNFDVMPTVDGVSPAWELGPAPSELASPGVLPGGHLTPATSTVTAAPEAVLAMPHASWTPLLTALGLSAAFTGVLLETWWIAISGCLGVIASLAAWHRPGPEGARR
jgi:heme/copper-type cytochrome/quinol oxidase subunit 1